MVNNYIPASLREALDIRAKESVIPYGGGTDLMIEGSDEASYLFVGKIPELKQVSEDEQYIRIGAECTFTELMENELVPAILREAVSGIGGPAIRNLGTVAGNIGNGSPKADSSLIFFVTDSKVRLMSAKSERIFPIKDFYLGRKQTALQSDELIVEILMPKTGLDNYYYKKIGARNAQAISRVSFAALMNITDGRIVRCATAFGAVSDVVIRRDDIDSMLTGKTVDEAKAIRSEYLAAFDKAIVPISGRISADYRKAVCMNLLVDFLGQNGIT